MRSSQLALRISNSIYVLEQGYENDLEHLLSAELLIPISKTASRHEPLEVVFHDVTNNTDFVVYQPIQGTNPCFSLNSHTRLQNSLDVGVHCALHYPFRR